MWLTGGAANLPPLEAADLTGANGPSAFAVSGDWESKVIVISHVIISHIF